MGGLAVVGRRLGWVKKREVGEEEKQTKTRKSSRAVGWRTTSTILVSSVMGIALFRLSNDAFVSKAMAGRIEFVHRKVGTALMLYR